MIFKPMRQIGDSDIKLNPNTPRLFLPQITLSDEKIVKLFGMQALKDQALTGAKTLWINTQMILIYL